MSIAWILTPAVSTIPFLAAIVRKSVAVFAKTVTSIWLLGALLLPMSALCAESKIKITEEQAVKIAETYVADHGFTRINPRAETVSSTESMPATAQSQVNSAANELPPLIPCEISLNSRDFLVAFKHIVDPVGQRLKVVMDEFGDVVQVQNPTVEHTNTTQLMTKAKTNRVIIYVADCMGSNNQATKSNNFEREADKDFDYSEYLNSIQAQIKKNWHPPYDGDLCTTLKFTINRDGSLGPIKTFGSPCVGSEKAARQAIQASSPFPALPSPKDDTIDIKFTFDFNVLNRLN